VATQSKFGKRVRTHVRTTERLDETPLSREEELVLRMSRGLSEDEAVVLEWQDPVTEETQAKLALIERAALMQGAADAQDGGVDASIRQRLLERLARLGDD
jgi:hypothetical protein